MIPRLGSDMGASCILVLSSIAKIRKTFFDNSETKFRRYVIIEIHFFPQSWIVANAIIKD